MEKYFVFLGPNIMTTNTQIFVIQLLFIWLIKTACVAQTVVLLSWLSYICSKFNNTHYKTCIFAQIPFLSINKSYKYNLGYKWQSTYTLCDAIL